MDDADRVTENSELIERSNFYKSKRHISNVVATGFCLFCGEPVEQQRRWCNSECRDDWVSENE